jgi:predicted regulator of Ras-like GTPase activity (Roadblock/LC7/MglB family)
MDTLRAVPPDFFSDLAVNGRVDTAMLLKRNGRLLAAWSHTPVSWEVVSIMAATTLGSLETMLETLRSPSPQSVSVVAGGNRMLIQKVEPQAILVLIAKESVPEVHLREIARKLLSRLPASPSGDTPRRVTLGPSAHTGPPSGGRGGLMTAPRHADVEGPRMTFRTPQKNP